MIKYKRFRIQSLLHKGNTHHKNGQAPPAGYGRSSMIKMVSAALPDLQTVDVILPWCPRADFRIYSGLLPPRGLDTAVVDFAMRSATQGNRQFIADPAAKGGARANFKLCASARIRPQTRHGCLATDLTWSRSRIRRGTGGIFLT